MINKGRVYFQESQHACEKQLFCKNLEKKERTYLKKKIPSLLRESEIFVRAVQGTGRYIQCIDNTLRTNEMLINRLRGLKYRT